MSSWIQTISGRRVDPLNPNPDDLVIDDIAHALSMICRFTGHCLYFLSVAEHSVNVSKICSPADQLAGLLHDASEAYLADIARPVKHTAAMAGYREIEANLQRVLLQKFCGIEELSPGVHFADNQMLATEAAALMKDVTDWQLPTPHPDIFIRGFSPDNARASFLYHYELYTHDLARTV